jgi:hypothetical protein
VEKELRSRHQIAQGDKHEVGYGTKSYASESVLHFSVMSIQCLC